MTEHSADDTIRQAVDNAMPSGKPTQPTKPKAGPVSDPLASQTKAPGGGDFVPDETEGDTWGDPILFDSGAVTPEIDANWLPGIFGEYADCLAQNLQAPPALVVGTIISVLSAALARKLIIGPYPDDAYCEPVNVWTLGVAESGERKSQILGRCHRPLVFWEKERGRAEKSALEENISIRNIGRKRAEKLETDAAKADDADLRASTAREAAELKANLPEEMHPTQIFTGDSTPEAAQELLSRGGGRMAFLSDESGLLLVMAGVYGGGEAVLDVFLQGYSGNDVRVSRRCRSVMIERPAVTLGLSIQPGILADFPQAAKRKFRASGLFARFFPVFPRSNIGRRDVRRRVAISENLQAAYDRSIMNLLEFEPADGEAVRLSLDDKARALWLDFSERMEEGQAEGGEYSDIRDWIAKLPGGVLRLSGLFHMAEHGTAGASLPVTEETLAKAVWLALNLIGHARAVFGLVGAEKVIDDAKAVWTWIKQTGLTGFLRSEAHKKFHGRFGKVEDLKAALMRIKRLLARRSARTWRRPAARRHGREGLGRSAPCWRSRCRFSPRSS